MWHSQRTWLFQHTVGPGAGFTRVAHACCWRSYLWGVVRFPAFPIDLAKGFSYDYLLELGCCNMVCVKILGALWCLNPSQDVQTIRFDPSGESLNPWAHEVVWNSIGSLQATTFGDLLAAGAEANIAPVWSLTWPMVKYWDDQWLMIIIWAVFPSPGVRIPPTSAPALPRPARHESFHQSSSELKAAHLRGKGAWDFQDPLTCKDEQDVSLRLHLRYFCFFVHVFYGSIIEGQGLKAREQRLQRFGWFMGRDLKARGGICQHHGRHGICMDMPFLYTADVGILRLRFLQTCCRLQTARPGPRKVQYCSTEMKQPCVF